ncbi:MAG: DUF2282 domain-containing protein [Cocleimonas sp.]
MHKNKIFKTIAFTTITMSVLSMSATIVAAETKMEKCTGIVKAGKADGQSTIDGKQVDWILLQEGQCMKFVGGKVVFEKK